MERKQFKKGRIACWGVLLAFVLGGCNTSKEVVFEPIPTNLPPTERTDRERRSFEAYLEAGKRIEAESKHINRTTFFPRQKQESEAVVLKVWNQVTQAATSECRFDYQPQGFQTKDYPLKGWRMIGRVLAWRIERAVKAGDYDAAIAQYRIGLRFGLHLAGGDAETLSLGLGISDECRRALLPAIRKLGAGQLNRLSQIISAAMKAKPPLESTALHETYRSRMILSLVQQAYREASMPALITTLGKGLEDDLTRVSKMKPSEAASFFSERLKEIEEYEQSLRADARLAVPKRGTDFDLGSRKFRAFRRSMLSGGRAMLGIHDASIARTRLLAIYANLIAQAKSKGSVPRNLKSFPPAEIQDPYSGYPFVYRSDGREFLVYSVGIDGKDDLGETDSSFLSPDLCLEIPAK